MSINRPRNYLGVPTGLRTISYYMSAWVPPLPLPADLPILLLFSNTSIMKWNVGWRLLSKTYIPSVAFHPIDRVFVLIKESCLGLARFMYIYVTIYIYMHLLYIVMFNKWGSIKNTTIMVTLNNGDWWCNWNYWSNLSHPSAKARHFYSVLRTSRPIVSN